MGIFDEIKSVTSLAEQHPAALAAVMSYVNSPQVGGVSGLEQMFQQKGLGGLVSSWVGTGPNLPVSAEQLQSVLHSGALNEAAQSLESTRVT